MEIFPLDILVKYFDGTITDEELSILSEWIEESEKNKEEFLTMYRIWNSLEFIKYKGNIDIDQELDTFRKRIFVEKVKPKSNKNTRIVILTAFAVACAVIAALIFNMNNHHISDKPEDIMSFVNTSMTTNFTTSKDIQLILSDDNKVDLDAESADIQYKDDRITMDDGKNISKEKSSNFNQLLIPFGKRSSITFSDGTKVWANAGTHLVYPVEFNNEKREIFVDGQIYLDVAKDANRPFIVKTKDMDIKVLGTKFNITAYSKENDNNIVLVSGKVNILNRKTNNNATLTPNKIYKYNKSSLNEEINDVDVNLYTSWIDGKYIFNKESFDVVISRISMYYGVSVDCDKDAGKYLCSGKLNLRDEFGTVLEGLANSVPISYTMKDGIYKIKLLK